jgi:two-component system, sensor histidine kinase RpfC
LNSLTKLIKFNELGDEYQQAFFRLAIVALTVIFILSSYSNLDHSVKSILFSFAILSSITFFHTRKYPTTNKIRLYLVMLGDVIGTSVSMYITSDIGSIFVGVYLWLVIGYGFRFGKKLLIATYFASLIGFLCATLSSPFWQSHAVGFYGLLFTICTIPIYALTLLSKLQEATRKAEAASQAKSEFLSHISHEIRTPLNGIIGACSLIEPSKIDKKNQPLFQVIRNSSNLLLELVNDVLDLSSIESGKVKSQSEVFYLENLVLNTTNLFEAQAKQKGVVVDYEINSNVPKNVIGDLMHCKQVLVNLVGNAVKFTEKGRVTVRVNGLTKQDNQMRIRFEVTDTGIGIAQESIGKIFESFTQADSNIKFKFGGTGLGTTISKNLVELMGGNIGIDSELGVGSTFWFELPFKLLEQETQDALESSEIISFKKIANQDKKKTCRILVAEDNDTNILILTQMLNLAGHEYDVVKNGLLALDKLEQNDYDLMILDHNMPEMGGLEALKIYQAVNIGLPVVPAIILSADATEATMAKFEAVNVAAYLTKPIQLDLLLTTIEQLATSVSKPINQASAQVLKFEDAKKPIMTPAYVEEKVNYLNQSRIEELISIGQSNGFLLNLINGFIEDTDEQFFALNKAVMNDDYVEANQIAHAMAGSALNVGAEQFGELCETLESLVPTDGSLATMYEDALDIYNKTKEALAIYIVPTKPAVSHKAN